MSGPWQEVDAFGASPEAAVQHVGEYGYPSSAAPGGPDPGEAVRQHQLAVLREGWNQKQAFADRESQRALQLAMYQGNVSHQNQLGVMREMQRGKHSIEWSPMVKAGIAAGVVVFLKWVCDKAQDRWDNR